MNKEYQSSVEQIKVDGENYATSEMKGVFLAQAAALTELHKIIGKVYIDYAKDGMLSLTTAEKATITAKTTKTLKGMGLTLGKGEVDAVKGILANVFKDTYYKNIYTLENGMTVNLKFNILKKEFVNAAVNAKYKGELFSDRIWTNKADMIDALQKNITGAMKGDTTIDKIGQQISNTFNTTAYDSQRLVNTEVARVQTQASEDMGRDTGIEQVMWSATLENNTCDECAALDGSIYPIDDAPDCPEHPECRCCLINVPYEEWSPTSRKDNESGDIIDYTNYADWAKDKRIGGDNNE